MPLNDHARDEMPALLRATAPRPGPAGPDCLDEATIAAMADGALDAGSRTVATQHLASCARCRTAVAAVSRIMADAAVAKEAAAAERLVAAWRWHLPVGLAAAAIILLFAWPRPVDDGRLVHRAPTITAATQPVVLAPVGAVADAATFRWAAVAGADRYRLTLFDSAGRVLYETLLGDTAVALPDSVALSPGRTYFWKVEARTGWDRWSASELVEFSIVKAGLR